MNLHNCEELQEACLTNMLPGCSLSMKRMQRQSLAIVGPKTALGVSTEGLGFRPSYVHEIKT